MRTYRVSFCALILVGMCAAGQVMADAVARWNLREGLDDLAKPSSSIVRTVGSPMRTDAGVRFDGDQVQGLIYDSGTRDELRLHGDFTLWVRAAFGAQIDRPLANHDTLLSRWGAPGGYSVLLRTDHRTKTLRLFLSPDGKTILTYDSWYRVDRTSAFHDVAVVFRAGKDVTFYVDGRRWAVLRDPPAPQAVYDPPGDAMPFAIGYNSDPAPGGDHETMNGTISSVLVFQEAVAPDKIASLSGLTAEQAGQCRIEVDAARPIGQVNPRLFGHFIEHYQSVVYGGLYEEGSAHSDDQGFRTDVLAALKNLEPSIIRWPGGNYTSAYHWKWGAVPTKYRPTTYDEPVWHQTETHRFGTPEFIEVCRRLGAEPLICVGVGRDPRSPTADEAAAWVRYCNSTEGPEAELRAEAGHLDPFNVLIWGLGNEVYGSWQIGWYKDPKDYAQDVVTYARKMREADPRIKFVICGDSYKEDNTPWNRAVLTDDVVRLADWISYHTYTHMGSFGPLLPHEVATNHLLKIESDIEELAELNREASRRAGRSTPIKLAVDEWNALSWGDPQDNARPELYDLGHALFTSGFLNVLLRHADDVTMANYSPSVNCRGLIFADKRGVLLRSSYHVFDMYREAGGGTAVTVRTNAPALEGSAARLLDSAAVRMPNGEMRLFVVNREPVRSVPCLVKLTGFSARRSSAKVLTANSLSGCNDFNHPRAVEIRNLELNVKGGSFQITFPGRSVVMLRLEP
jgi:alpha-N-arabinofuranosidase